MPQDEIPGVFATLVPGEITELPQKEVTDDAPIVDFRWNGFGTRIGIVPSEPSLGSTPAEQCATSGPGNGECTELPDGTWVQALTSTGPEADGGITSTFVTAYTTDGWNVLAASHNAASAKGGPVLAAEPPISVEQLTDVVTSDVWFVAFADTPSTTPVSPGPQATPSPSAARIGVAAVDIPGLVTAVVPGDVVPYEPAGGYIDAGSDVVAHFQLDGMLVTAGISESIGDDVARKCRQDYRGTSTTCTTLPDGFVVARAASTGPEADGAVSTRAVTLYRPGFQVYVLSYNAAGGKDSPGLSPEPPLGFGQLTRIVCSDGWVETD